MTYLFIDPETCEAYTRETEPEADEIRAWHLSRLLIFRTVNRDCNYEEPTLEQPSGTGAWVPVEKDE